MAGKDARKPRGLVLARSEGEGIQIGDDITVWVHFDHRHGSGQVKLVIDAPRRLPVRRLELIERTD